MVHLLPELVLDAAHRRPDAEALAYRGERVSYGALAAAIEACARGLVGLGVERGDRVAVFLEKRIETVIAMFAAARAGAVFVPVNPLLRPPQVGYIVRDCAVKVLVTSPPRLHPLADELARSPELAHVVVVDGEAEGAQRWDDVVAGGGPSPHRVIDADMAAILYTSGSTGMPKGVVLSHRNLVAGAESVASYLGNVADDRILAVLPFSFDYGLSQVTTAFRAGATAVLMNYLLPRDVLAAVAAERITGLGCVPPLWVQLARLAWPEAARESLRYITNTGGAMPRTTLAQLRAALPATRVFLMYGLTEAFRSTYLDPDEVDRRPGSIGKAIPNAEVMVVDREGRPCPPGVAGELVHRGALVALGYWNDPARTAERFRPAPGQPAGLSQPEIAVWSGDTVTTDADGFLYFVGREDEMIKTSGYRVSPTEVEEAIFASGLVAEAVAFGVPHDELGQAVVAVVAPPAGATVGEDEVVRACREVLPRYMVPLAVVVREALPRTPNGKIDRPTLRAACIDLFEAEARPA